MIKAKHWLMAMGIMMIAILSVFAVCFITKFVYGIFLEYYMPEQIAHLITLMLPLSFLAFWLVIGTRWLAEDLAEREKEKEIKKVKKGGRKWKL